MTHDEFELTAFDGLKLYCQEWRVETEPKGVICLVHGLGEHSGRYTHWAEMLNQAGYSVLTFDLRGHGKSGGQRGHASSYEDYFKDLDLLIREARQRYPSQACFLYGHSLGAVINIAYVLERKPRLDGVILTGLATQTSLQDQKAKILLAKILAAVAPRMNLSSGLVPATISRDVEVVTRYINDPLVHHDVSLAWGVQTLETIAFIEEHAGEWDKPVLIMHGGEDRLAFTAGSREFAGKIKADCTLKIWDGLYHEIHNEPEKDQVFEFLLSWLDSHLTSS